MTYDSEVEQYEIDQWNLDIDLDMRRKRMNTRQFDFTPKTCWWTKTNRHEAHAQERAKANAPADYRHCPSCGLPDEQVLPPTPKVQVG